MGKNAQLVLTLLIALIGGFVLTILISLGSGDHKYPWILIPAFPLGVFLGVTHKGPNKFPVAVISVILAFCGQFLGLLVRN